MNTMRIAILQPIYKNIPSKSYQSMINFLGRLYTDGDKVAWLTVDDTNIVSARSQLSQEFIHSHKKNAYELVLWLDSDHVFTHKNFLCLYNTYAMKFGAQHVVSARYNVRNRDIKEPCLYNWNPTIADTLVSSARDGVCEVDAAGFGFILMHPDIMIKMWDEYGAKQFMFIESDSGLIYSEDISWCIRARKLGIKIYADNDVQIGHCGGVI